MHLILFFVLLFLPGCKRQAIVTHFQGRAHTHAYHVQIAQKLSPFEKEEVALLLQDVFDMVDTYYNHWNPSSELSQVNKLLVGESLSISSQLLDLIKEAESLTTLTEGHFDPTCGAVISKWKRALSQSLLPTATTQPIGWHTFSFEQGKAKRLVDGALIDLDGLLKGFAIDHIFEKLREKGFLHFYIEWGGDMRAFGRHPSGRNWMVSMPAFKENPVPLDMALATSGNEHQSREIDGRRYSHIVIPENKQALLSIESVSVKAPTCLFADALATAFMTYPSIDAILTFLDTHEGSFRGCTVWITTLEGEKQKWEHTAQ